MGMRRRARETALQILYQLDVQPELEVESALTRFYSALSAGEDGAREPAKEKEEETREFAERLVRGVMANLPEIDARIVRASRNWRLERMARVDRNLLRLATYELAFCDDIPAKVAINEAIEVAKRFGAHETPSFVNGILDRVLDEIKTPV
jgi:N utilization substance protein B